MSFQAMAWACGTKESPMIWGGPSARSAIYAITDHANDEWFCCAKQETLARESEQSLDSVQRRIQEFVDMGRLRRIKLKRFGRRTFDFLILKPSPYFDAPIEEIEPFIPRGCEIMPELDAAADCGSDKNDSPPESLAESPSGAAADCGSVETPETAATLPQPAVHATALVRQQEPFLEPKKDSLPQTPSPTSDEASGQAQWLSGKRERFQKLLDAYATNALTPTCSNPEAAFLDWQKLSDQQEAQAMQGARGIAEVRRRDPKAKGVVGLNRYLRSSALWAEYGRFATVDRTAPPPRIFVPVGSEEWRARAVIAGIVGRDMPPAKFDEKHGCDGADFLGALPPAGLVLAQFADQFGQVNIHDWLILHGMERWNDARATEADKRDRPKIAAWIERIAECTGVRLAPGLIYTDGFHTITNASGQKLQCRNRVTGLRVPAAWPPAKGKATAAHNDPLSDESTATIKKTG